MADDRTYIRVHDGIDEHHKIEGLSDAAFRLLISSWAYCSRNLNDGRITDAAWKRKGSAKARAELLAAGLAEQRDDGFVEMHDYLEHQRSAAEVAELRASKGASGSLGNHIRWHVSRRQPDPTCEHCNPVAPIANGSQERSQMRSQTDRTPIANGSHSQRQSHNYTPGTTGGGSHVSRGSETSAPPQFPDHCAEHANDPTPGKCGLCADARKARAAMPHLALVVSERPEWCGSCNEFTRLIDSNGDGPSRRCQTCHPLALEASA